MSARKLKVRHVHLVEPTARRDGRFDLNTRDMRIIEIVREKRLMTPRRNVPLKKLRRLKPLSRMQTSRPHAVNFPTQLGR